MTLPSLATFMARARGVARADTLDRGPPERRRASQCEEWSLPVTQPIVIGLLHPGEMRARKR
jgi:hypothetical protein